MQERIGLRVAFECGLQDSDSFDFLICVEEDDFSAMLDTCTERQGKLTHAEIALGQ